jgi:outer membrane protein assembly factor BamB
MCTDTDGRLLWTNNNLPFESVYGVGVSPVISDDVIVVASGMPAGPFVSAIDARTGRELWRREQSVNLGYIGGTSRTPIVHEINGSKVVLVWGWDALRCFDLRSGRELCRYATPDVDGDMVASLVVHEDTVYLPYPGWVDALSISRLLKGEKPELWSSVDGGANCASPVLCNRMLFTLSDNGLATCLDERTGRVLWEQKLDGQYFSSAIAVGNNVLFTNHAGLTTIVAAEPQFRKIAENSLEERLAASVTPLNDKLFIRSDEYLYCIRTTR